MSGTIKVYRPYGPIEYEVDGTAFSTEVPLERADAIICEWAPHEILETYGGPSGWYSAEPAESEVAGVLATPEHRRFLGLLRPEQRLYHAHPDPRFRVPHITHIDPLEPSHQGHRAARAVAMIANRSSGEATSRSLELRDAFATSRLTDLYGPEWVWTNADRSWLGRARPPRSYRGDAHAEYRRLKLGNAPADIDWPRNPVKIALFARYEVAICLENSVEPFYFSEKFVDGVRAGCVPIYEAHPTVRAGVLKGATWVDPADFDFDPEATIRAALALDRREVADANDRWLRSSAAQATSWHNVWLQIRNILLGR